MKKFKFEPMSLIYLIATYLCSWIFKIFLVEFVRFSGIFELKFLVSRIDPTAPAVLAVTHEICFLISFIIFDIIFRITQKSQRKDFIDTTKGLLTKKDGLKYHIQRHLATELVLIALQVIADTTLFFIKKELCPLALIYNVCGLPIGILASITFLIVMHINHILLAQYNWRVSYYMYE